MIAAQMLPLLEAEARARQLTLAGTRPNTPDLGARVHQGLTEHAPQPPQDEEPTAHGPVGMCAHRSEGQAAPPPKPLRHVCLKGLL